MRTNRELSINQLGVKSGSGLISSALSTVKKNISKIPIGTVVNRAIDALPVELHPFNYQFCGPGTKLAKRLARNDPGINELDRACKDHDIAYAKYSDTANRTIADKILADKAWQRVKSSDASLSEKAVALAVTAAMKAKSAVGGGHRRKSKKRGKTVKRGGNIRKRRTNKKKIQTILAGGT